MGRDCEEYLTPAPGQTVDIVVQRSEALLAAKSAQAASLSAEVEAMRSVWIARRRRSAAVRA